MERIQYNPQLVILNAESLPAGTGAKYLECIRSHTGELIAKAWHRLVPKGAEIVVRFGK